MANLLESRWRAFKIIGDTAEAAFSKILELPLSGHYLGDDHGGAAGGAGRAGAAGDGAAAS